MLSVGIEICRRRSDVLNICICFFVIVPQQEVHKNKHKKTNLLESLAETPKELTLRVALIVMIADDIIINS